MVPRLSHYSRLSFLRGLRYLEMLICAQYVMLLQRTLARTKGSFAKRRKRKRLSEVRLIVIDVGG